MSDSGRLFISESILRYAVLEREVWSMPVSELAIVGHGNASQSPFADGYFLVFVCGDGVPYVAPYFADGARDVVESLPHVEKPFPLSVSISSTWYSRIVYPASLAGQPLLELVDPSVAGSNIPVASGLGSGSLVAILARGLRSHLAVQDADHD